MAQIT